MPRNLHQLPLNEDPQLTDWLLGASGLSPAVFQKMQLEQVKNLIEGDLSAALSNLENALSNLEATVSNLETNFPTKIKGLHSINIAFTTNGARQLATFAFPVTVVSFIDLRTTAGTCQLSLQIDGVAISPMSAILVGTSPQNIIATANNLGDVGQRLALIISNNSSGANLSGSIYLESAL